MDNQEPVPIAGYGTGRSNAPQINGAITSAWGEILRDPNSAAEAASILKVPVEELPNMPPYFAEPYEGGTGVVETALIIFAYKLVDDVAYDLVKDVAKDAVKGALKVLWDDIVQERVEDQLESGGFGPERPIPDDVQ
jgi:hypothetical protein